MKSLIEKWARFASLRAAGVALVLALAAPAFASDPGADAARLPSALCASPSSPVDAAGFVSIGGIDQWVTLRGARCGNSLILVVHGGPGNPMSPFSRAVFGDWERDHVIVQWDQRGAGRTFGRNAGSSEAALSVALIAQDGIELAEFLSARLDGRKIIVMATSWGSVPGVHMVKARPDLFRAYVGLSQLVSYRDNQAASYGSVLAAARAAQDEESVAAIAAVGPPPWTDPRSFGIVRRIIRAQENRTAAPAPRHWWVRDPLYATAQDLADYEAGEDHSYLQFVGRAGDGLFSRVDLPSLGARFELPVFLVMGAQDLLTVPDVAQRWFDTIEAPEKAFLLVPASGHDPNAAMMDAARDLLGRHVRGEAVR